LSFPAGLRGTYRRCNGGLEETFVITEEGDFSLTYIANGCGAASSFTARGSIFVTGEARVEEREGGETYIIEFEADEATVTPENEEAVELIEGLPLFFLFLLLSSFIPSTLRSVLWRF